MERTTSFTTTMKTLRSLPSGHWIARTPCQELPRRANRKLRLPVATAGVALDDRRCVRALLDRFEPTPGAVGRIFIHLEKGTDPALYAPFGGILVPVRGAFQLALALRAMGLVDAVTVAQTRAAVAAASGKWAQDPAAMRADAIARGLISEEKTRELP